jgi:hypothetical protein
MRATTGKDLHVSLQDRPGTLAKASQAIADARINIDGYAALSVNGQGVFHVFTQDAAATRRALEQAGFQVRDERDVVIVQAQNKPGELANVLSRIADQEINIEVSYSISGDRFIIGAKDTARLREAIEQETPTARRTMT